MMWLTGLFLIFAGLVGVFTEEFYPEPPNYLFRFSDEVWGWTQLVTGLLVFFAGAALLSAQLWARILAVVMAGVTILEAFLWLPTYPLWSVIIIAVGVLVIWALTVHGHDIERQRFD